MTDAIKALRDYLSKSPSVVYPQDVLEYLPAIEAENAKLRELCADIYEMAYHEYPSAFEATFADRMRELRVEVE